VKISLFMQEILVYGREAFVYGWFYAVPRVWVETLWLRF
jgi:hypothetical protein